MSRKTISVNVDVDVDLNDILEDEYDREEILDRIPDEEIVRYMAKCNIKPMRTDKIDFANELKELCNAYKLCYTKQDLREVCEELIELTTSPK